MQFACKSQLLKVLLEHSSISKMAILAELYWLDFFIHPTGIYCKFKRIFYEDFHTCTSGPISQISIETSTIIRAFRIGAIGFWVTLISKCRSTFVNVCWKYEDAIIYGVMLILGEYSAITYIVSQYTRRYFLPVQIVPFTEYPWRHVHTYEPSVFVQFDCRSHLLKVLLKHSSMSKIAILTDIRLIRFFH